MSCAARLAAEAQRAIAVYAADARAHRARRLSYTDFAVLMGYAPSRARGLGPLLAALRQACHARGLPDICTVIVAAGTEMPSARSFDVLTGIWHGTVLDRDGVRAEQARVLAWDWAQVARAGALIPAAPPVDTPPTAL